MIWSYNKNIGFVEKAFIVTGFGAYGFALFTPGLITEQQFQIIASSNSVLSKYGPRFIICLGVIGKVPQIFSNFTNKSTG